VVAVFVNSSISSGGDGQEQFEGVAAALPDNPHIRWQNSQRGYLRCSVTQEEWRSDYRIVPFVTRPGASVHTGSSWTVERGKPGIRPG